MTPHTRYIIIFQVSNLLGGDEELILKNAFLLEDFASIMGSKPLGLEVAVMCSLVC